MENIRIIADKLKTINKKLYTVGGFCREKILGREHSGDIDIVTDATPDEMKKVLQVVGEVGKKYGTCIVSEGGDAFELTTFRKDIGSINNRKPAEVEFTDSLEEDAQRRDFTCNAIYLHPESEEYIDPTGGKKDMEDRIIRFVGNIEDRIQEDALRILRFVRFKNKYNFKIAEESYWDVLKKNITLLKNLPIERIKQELDKIILNKNNSEALEDLKRIGFLKLFVPELHCLDKFPGNKYHQEGDVWIHTKMCLDEINKVIERDGITDEERKLILLWGILLHDIGKGPTFSMGDDGESHYYNHENVGADMFKKDIADRLLFSNEQRYRIFFLIEEHLRVFKIPNMKKLKSRKLMTHDYFNDLLIIGEADNRGRIPTKEEDFQEVVRIYKEFQGILKLKIFLTGNDIMEKYPELEGRKIGERLEQMNNQILITDN